MTEYEVNVRAALLEAARKQDGTWSISEKFIKDAARALQAKLQPPPKKVWSVHPQTAEALRMSTTAILGVGGDVEVVNRFANCIIRERPDLVAAEWERRYQSAYGGLVSSRPIRQMRHDLFPELDP